jgi:hypothetical protein
VIGAARILVCIGVLLTWTAAQAAILVIPGNPLPTEEVVIRLTRHYSSDAFITSATISRIGNLFTIEQSVTLGCSLPNSPILTSEFNVGVLPAGEYQVVANIHVTSNHFPCSPPLVTETAAFVVAPFAVPTASGWTYLLLAILLLASGLYRHRRFTVESGR